MKKEKNFAVKMKEIQSDLNPPGSDPSESELPAFIPHSNEFWGILIRFFLFALFTQLPSWILADKVYKIIVIGGYLAFTSLILLYLSADSIIRDLQSINKSYGLGSKGAESDIQTDTIESRFIESIQKDMARIFGGFRPNRRKKIQFLIIFLIPIIFWIIKTAYFCLNPENADMTAAVITGDITGRPSNFPLEFFIEINAFNQSGCDNGSIASNFTLFLSLSGSATTAYFTIYALLNLYFGSANHIHHRAFLLLEMESVSIKSTADHSDKIFYEKYRRRVEQLEGFRLSLYRRYAYTVFFMFYFLTPIILLLSMPLYSSHLKMTGRFFDKEENGQIEDLHNFDGFIPFFRAFSGPLSAYAIFLIGSFGIYCYNPGFFDLIRVYLFFYFRSKGVFFLLSLLIFIIPYLTMYFTPIMNSCGIERFLRVGGESDKDVVYQRRQLYFLIQNNRHIRAISFIIQFLQLMLSLTVIIALIAAWLSPPVGLQNTDKNALIKILWCVLILPIYTSFTMHTLRRLDGIIRQKVFSSFTDGYENDAGENIGDVSMKIGESTIHLIEYLRVFSANPAILGTVAVFLVLSFDKYYYLAIFRLFDFIPQYWIKIWFIGSFTLSGIMLGILLPFFLYTTHLLWHISNYAPKSFPEEKNNGKNSSANDQNIRPAERSIPEIPKLGRKVTNFMVFSLLLMLSCWITISRGIFEAITAFILTSLILLYLVKRATHLEFGNNR